MGDLIKDRQHFDFVHRCVGIYIIILYPNYIFAACTVVMYTEHKGVKIETPLLVVHKGI